MEPRPSQDRRQLVGCVANSIAHTGWRPILLTGLMRQLLTSHFSNPRYVEDPDLRDGPYAAIWRDTLQSGILIETTHRWRGELVEKRPAVLVKRNAFRNLRVTIGDRAGVSERGFENFVTLWVGSHTLFCIHGSGASCEILATEVQRELTQFGPAIGQTLALHKFQVTEVGEISVVEEAKQNFIVPITVGWCYEETWELRPEALPLANVDISMVMDC